MKARAEATGDSLDGGDPACRDTTDHGRKVRVCYCTGDRCNAAGKTSSSWAAAAAAATVRGN